MKISEAVFAGSSTRVSEKPQLKLPEFAFIGRSNVGKSSLINMLCGRTVAKTSATPGKTRLVNHFKINGEWYLVDLPGYGYAKMSLGDKEKLQAVIRDFINHSDELTMLFVLVDIRHDMQKADLEFIREVGASDIPFALIFTKGDKIGPVVREQRMNAYKNGLLDILPGLPPCFASSSQTGLGKDEILGHIEQVLSSLKDNL